MTTYPQNTCSLPESIRCYLLRGNTMVPLVPADQLPFQLKGIPRQLGHRQMSDQGWKLFKETTEVPFVLSVQAPTTNDLPSHCSPGKAKYLAPDHHVRAELQIAQENLHRAGRPSQPSSAAMDTASESLGLPFTAAVERQSPLADAVVSIYPSDAQRLGYSCNTGSDSHKKVYCTHWIATGECKWMHTGCKYKHEMPGTEKLRELGFTRGTPKWWKEKNAVSPPKPLTWMQRKMARVDDAEPQTGDVPAPRTFPDPSTFRARKPEERSEDLDNESQKTNRAPREEQPPALKQSLPVPPSVQTPSVRGSLQTPNLIDLDETPILPCSPPCSQTSSSELIVASAYIPESDTSDSSPLSLASLDRKTKPGKQSRTRIRHPTPISSSASSAASPSSSSSESSDTDSSDTDAPSTSTQKTKRATLPTHQRRSHHSHRRTTSNHTATTTNIASSTHPAKTPPTAQPSQLGLAGSRYAVQTPAFPSSTSSKAPQDTRTEYSMRKAHRKERRAERSA